MVKVSPTCFDYCPFRDGHNTMALEGRFEGDKGRNNTPRHRAGIDADNATFIGQCRE